MRLVKLRVLARQFGSFGIVVEFVRDGPLRIVTFAMAERGDESTMDYRSAIIGERFRASIEEQNRSAAWSDRSSKPIKTDATK
jgi:hypothetical protein